MQIDYRVSRTPRYLGVCGDIPSIFTASDGSFGSNRSYVEFHGARVKEKCNFIIAKRTKGGVFGFRVSLEVIAPSSDFQEGEI